MGKLRRLIIAEDDDWPEVISDVVHTKPLAAMKGGKCQLEVWMVVPKNRKDKD